MSSLDPAPRRRRLAVRLRALMLVIAVAALWLGWRVDRAHTQARAVARIEAAGGRVWYDYELDANGALKPNPSPWTPIRLLRLLGAAFFQEVAAVTFQGETTDEQLEPVENLDRLVQFTLLVPDGEKRVTDAGLARLSRLKSLRAVRIEDAHVNDAGLAHLAGLPQLQELWLKRTDGITEAGWAHLARMTKLRELVLFHAGINDAGTRHLAGLTRLGRLEIFPNPFTDAGLARLRDLKALHALNLSNSAIALSPPTITDAGLAHLTGLTGLQELHFSDNRITGAGLAHLAGLADLRKLDLCDNPISDEGLRHLRGLHRLRSLDLDYSGVDDEAVAELKAAIPGLAVSCRKARWRSWAN